MKKYESSLDLTMTKNNEKCSLRLTVSTINGTEETCTLIAQRFEFTYLIRAVPTNGDFISLNLADSTDGMKCTLESVEDNYVLKYNMVDNKSVSMPMMGGCHDLRKEEWCNKSESCVWSNNMCKPKSFKQEMNLGGGCHDLWNEEMCNTSTCMWNNGSCVEIPMLGGCHDLYNEEMCKSDDSCVWNDGCKPRTLNTYEMPILGGCHDLRKEEWCNQSESCVWSNNVCKPKSFKQEKLLGGGCFYLWKKEMCIRDDCVWSDNVCKDKPKKFRGNTQ